MSEETEHYRMIGAVSANWAALEYLMNDALWQLAQLMPELGACFTSQIPNMGRRCDALAALAKLKGASKATMMAIHKFSNKADEMQRRRNRIVHDSWRFNPETRRPERLEVSAVKGVGVTIAFKPVTNDEIQDFAFDIVEQIRAFYAVFNLIKADVAEAQGGG